MQTTDRHAAPWRVNIDSSIDFENELARQGWQLAQASQIDAKYKQCLRRILASKVAYPIVSD